MKKYYLEMTNEMTLSLPKKSVITFTGASGDGEDNWLHEPILSVRYPREVSTKLKINQIATFGPGQIEIKAGFRDCHFEVAPVK